MLTDLKPIHSTGQTPADFTHSTLVVQVEKGSVCLFSFSDGSLAGFEEHRFSYPTFESLLTSLSKKNFESVSVVIDHHVSSLFPNEFLDLSNLSAQANALFGHQDYFYTTALTTESRSFLYGFESAINRLIVKYLPSAKILPSTEIFLKNAEANCLNNSFHAAIEVRDGFFNIVVFSEVKLQLINSYRFNSIPQFGFYCLGVLKNYFADLDNIKVQIGGRIEKDSPIVQLLKRHIVDIELVKSQYPDLTVGFHHQLVQYFAK